MQPNMPLKWTVLGLPALLTAYLISISGCATQHRQPLPALPVAAPQAQAPTPVATVTLPSDAEFVDSMSPEVREAFDKYATTGKAPVIVKKSSGFVQWPFGLSQPTARCRPLEACRFEFEAGEIIRTVAIGDQERWIPQLLHSGPDSLITTHLMLKPTDLLGNMETTITVGTDRRVYEMRAISRAQGPMIRAKWYYPEDLAAALNSRPVSKPKPAPVVDMAAIAATRSQYLIEGDEELKPTLVGNDEDHTYFLMPTSLHTMNAPALCELSSSGERIVIPYRLIKGFYVADKLLTHAALVWGVGDDERIVTITHTVA